MTAPGWYHAETDPVGTNRYWDGERWVGDAVAVPGAGGFDAGGYFAEGSTAVSTFPSGLKTLAIIVSVFKALGWVVLLISTIWVASFYDDANDLEEAIGDSFDFSGIVGALVASFAVVLIIGGALLFFQFRAAAKENASSLFVVALIMTILDGLSLLLLLLGAIGDSDGGSFVIVVMYLATFVAQLMVTIKAKQAS